nr:MAG TPA: hypothetical protein [Bacteriophage sp.]
MSTGICKSENSFPCRYGSLDTSVCNSEKVTLLVTPQLKHHFLHFYLK